MLSDCKIAPQLALSEYKKMPFAHNCQDYVTSDANLAQPINWVDL